MNVTTIAALAVFAGLGAAVWLLVVALVAPPASHWRPAPLRLHVNRRVQTAVTVAIAVAVLTRWPVAGVAAAGESDSDGFSGGRGAAACLLSGVFGADAAAVDLGTTASGRGGSLRLASITFGFARARASRSGPTARNLISSPRSARRRWAG